MATLFQFSSKELKSIGLIAIPVVVTTVAVHQFFRYMKWGKKLCPSASSDSTPETTISIHCVEKKRKEDNDVSTANVEALQIEL